MLYSKKVSIPIYGGYIAMFVYDNDDDFKLHDKKNKIDKRKLLDAIAFVKESSLYIKNMHYYTVEIIFRAEHFGFVTLGVLAHEALHAADSIFHRIGAKNKFKNSEPYAYLVQHITDILHLFIEEYGNFVRRSDGKLPQINESESTV